MIETLSGASWTASTASLPVADSGTLNGVDCLSSTSCVAVGSQLSKATTAPLVEVLGGSAWTPSVLIGPAGLTDPTLSSVSCTTSTSCVAVGSATQPSADSSYNLPGQNSVPFAEVLAGTTWTLSLLPTPAVSAGSQLTEISCFSAGSCVAIGTYLDSLLSNQTYVETLAGTTWSEVALPTLPSWYGSTPGGVSCPAVTDCIAVGSASLRSGAVGSFASSWNGTTWTTASLPGPLGGLEAGLTAISCTSGTACVAIGIDYLSKAAANSGVFAQNFEETLSATTWTASQLAGIHGALQPSIVGISCSAASSCVAVGRLSINNNSQYQNGNGNGVFRLTFSVTGGPSHALVQRLSGAAWTRSVLVDPAGPPAADLTSVSCATATSCVGVGAYATVTGTGLLVGDLAGGAWNLSQLPSASGVENFLESISCPRGPTCIAVGFQVDATRHWHPMYATDTNGTWVIRDLPSPVGSQDVELSNVSCSSSTFCLALGSYDQGGAYRQFFEVLRHRTWALTPIPEAMGKVKVTAGVGGVACVQDVCRAVGGTGSSAVIWTFAAGKWTLAQLRAPFKHAAMQLELISCRSRYSCEAEGEIGLRGRAAQVVETLSGTSWRPRVMTPFTAATDYFPVDLSCAPTGHCAVVLQKLSLSSLLSGGDIQFVSQLRSTSGASWSIDHFAVDPDVVQETVNSVACPSRLACTAVGSEVFVNGAQLPFVITGS